MNLDPIDFFPGYDPYYCCRQQSRSSIFSTMCTHLLAIMFSVGICGSAFFYYENYKKLEFEDLPNIQVIPNQQPQQQEQNKQIINIDDIKREMEKIKLSLEDTNNWRKQLTDLFTNIYVQQDAILKEKIEQALEVYDSDKIGLFDYASTYACASIVSTPDTFPYPANKSISILHLLNVDLLSNPEAVLQTANHPGNCFAFYGSTGRIRIKLGKKITIKSVTMDHAKLVEDARSAPRDFEVFGLYDPLDISGIFLGRFSYDLGGRPYQNFLINPNQTNVPFEYVELYILNNNGKREFTCVYRFRVHNSYPGETAK